MMRCLTSAKDSPGTLLRWVLNGSQEVTSAEEQEPTGVQEVTGAQEEACVQEVTEEHGHHDNLGEEKVSPKLSEHHNRKRKMPQTQ